MKNKLLLIFLLALVTFPLKAQVEFNGAFDFGITVGGDDSSFITNFIPQEYKYLHFSIAQASFFAFAPINDDFFFEARLQSDTYATGELSYPRFTLANLTYSPDGEKFSLKAGRFISPFGKYIKNQLLIDRTFIKLPLTYTYFVNISDVRGYWPAAGNNGVYTRGDVGLPTVYFGGYITGLRFDYELINEKLFLESALTAVSVNSDQDYTNLPNAALMFNLSYMPVIEWEFGLAASYGSFMRRDPVNNRFRSSTPLEQYRQTALSLNFRYGTGFWELNGESTFSHWNVPRFSSGTFDSRNNELISWNVSNIGSNLDIRFEPPSLTGSYFAIRAEHLSFFDAKSPLSGEDIAWDDDISRLSLTGGYKLSRNVELKLLLFEQTPYDRSKYGILFYITTLF